MQSITGKLNFVSYILPVGRCFIRRLYDLTINRSPNAIITLGPGAISDLEMWCQFLISYNAKELYADRQKLSSQTEHIFTDASSLGYGGTFQNEYFYGRFPPHWHKYDIQVKEFFPIFLLFSVKANAFRDKHLIIRTDNTSVAAAINRQTSKNKDLMVLLRKFVLLLLKYNIKCTAHHIEGKKNVVSDALSRLRISKALFYLLQLGLQPSPMAIPSTLRPMNLRSM